MTLSNAVPLVYQSTKWDYSRLSPSPILQSFIPQKTFDVNATIVKCLGVLPCDFPTMCSHGTGFFLTHLQSSNHFSFHSKHNSSVWHLENTLGPSHWHKLCLPTKEKHHGSREGISVFASSYGHRGHASLCNECSGCAECDQSVFLLRGSACQGAERCVCLNIIALKPHICWLELCMCVLFLLLNGQLFQMNPADWSGRSRLPWYHLLSIVSAVYFCLLKTFHAYRPARCTSSSFSHLTWKPYCVTTLLSLPVKLQHLQWKYNFRMINLITQC